MKKETSPDKLLSVVVPAYREGRTIHRALVAIQKVLDRVRYPYEVIVVVDGRVDDTFEEASRLASPRLKVFLYEDNHGKGYAVRYGIARSRGDYIAFIDADGELNPVGLRLFLDLLEWSGADIVVGSKRHPHSRVNYPWHRRFISRVLQMLTRFFFGLNVSDTQVGLKIFRRQVLEAVMPRLVVKRYAFDLEILSVAYRLGFRKMIEGPVELKYTLGALTRASTLRDIVRFFVDFAAIFYRMKIRHYYDSINHQAWFYAPELNFGGNGRLGREASIK